MATAHRPGNRPPPGGNLRNWRRPRVDTSLSGAPMASTQRTMPSPAHEIAVGRLVRDPSLLPALAKKLLRKRLRAKLRPVDSTVRFLDPAEVRPDLLLAGGRRGPWDAIEVQLRI